MGKNTPPEEIRAQLGRIRCSPAFASSPHLGSTIEFLVEEALAGRGDSIDDYAVGVKGLGYPVGFAPSANPVVHVLLRRARRALTAYYADMGVRDPVRIEIPAGSATPRFSPNA